jgi:hypothetical protein
MVNGGLMIARDDVAAAVRLLSGLPAFLRRRVTPDHARMAVRQRLAARGADFLEFVRRAVFEGPASPYRALLREAGCEYGDLTRLVEREGLEGALDELRRRGVYLTIEEFKGRCPVVRGATRLDVSPAQLRNPLSSVHVRSESSGSRGPRTSVGMDLAFVRDHAVNVSAFLDARGGLAWRQALWGVPGGFAMRVVLRLAAAGVPPERWFSQVDPGAPGLHPRYRWSARALRLGGIAARVRLPAPRFSPLERSVMVARWMADVLGSGGVPHLFTFPSSAVRLCEAAAEAGLSLEGARFWLTGEPITARRLRVVVAAGADAVGAYGSSECGGPIAYGCLDPGRRADLHLLADLHALVQPGDLSDGSPELPPRALLYSSLRAAAPFLLINVAIGDEAVVEPATCGCPLAELGWNTTLREVRSHAKLTGGGMSVLDADVLEALEDVLPRRFGGGLTDYQLVEDEDAQGHPVIRLLVHPRLGALDPKAVADAFLGAIGGGHGVDRVIELAWRDAGLVRVERRAPIATETGKIRHFHLSRTRVETEAIRSAV